MKVSNRAGWLDVVARNGRSKVRDSGSTNAASLNYDAGMARRICIDQVKTELLNRKRSHTSGRFNRAKC